MYWDRICITWEAYYRRQTRDFRARHQPRFSVPKGIKLLSSISTQPAQVSNSESVLNRQTYEGTSVSYPA